MSVIWRSNSRLGKIVETDFTPGIHLMIPFVNNIEKYPRQILTLNNPQEQFLTKEKKNVLVDFFVKWRITDVGQYYRASGGNESLAAQRLLEIMKDGIRGEFAKRTVPQVVAAQRRELLDAMLAAAREDAISLGIEIVDVRVKRIEFSDEVSESVFNRMRQERARIASELRAQGAESAEQIRADADRQRTVIVATAYRDAEKLRVRVMPPRPRSMRMPIGRIRSSSPSTGAFRRTAARLASPMIFLSWTPRANSSGT